MVTEHIDDRILVVIFKRRVELGIWDFVEGIVIRCKDLQRVSSCTFHVAIDR